MAIPLADRVKDSTLTTGSGAAIILSNTAPLGYVTFLQGFGSSSARPVCYCIEDPVTGAWETGFGTYTSATNLLNRATVTANSLQTTSRITLTAGTKDVFCTSISKSIIGQNAVGNIEIPNIGQGINVSIAPALSSAGYAPPGMSISCPAPTLAAQTGTYLDISAGAGSTTGDGGYAGLAGGSAPGSGLGGGLFLRAGDSLSGTAGNVELYAGGSSGAGGGGPIDIIAGDGGTSGGYINIAAGGVSASYAGNGGDITITSGLADGAGTNGSIEISLAGIVAIAISPANATATSPVKIGFFGATPVVKPTGVAVTAAAIHGALVSLGLISA